MSTLLVIPAYSLPNALISCITHCVVNKRTCPPSSPAVRSVASFRLHRNCTIVSGCSLFAQLCARQYTSEPGGRGSYCTYFACSSACTKLLSSTTCKVRSQSTWTHTNCTMCIIEACQRSHLVGLPKTVVYLVKLDCTSCMLVFLSPHTVRDSTRTREPVCRCRSDPNEVLRHTVDSTHSQRRARRRAPFKS